jgi:hypothetical protein
MTMPPGNAPSAPRLAGEPQRRNSGASMPRLTAVAPLLTNKQGEHEATVMLGPDGKPMTIGASQPGGMPGDTGFDEDEAQGDLAGLNLDGGDDDGGPGTIPMLGGNSAAMASSGRDGEAPFAKTYARGLQPLPVNGGPPRIAPAATNASRGANNLPPMRRPQPSQPGGRPPGSMAVVRDVVSAPVRAAHAGNEPSQVTSAPKRPGIKPALLAGIAAAIIVPVVVLAVGLKVFLGAPEGVLVLDLPSSVAGKAKITIGGEPLDDETAKSFPVMRKVKAGSVAVKIEAPGYEPLVEEYVVKEGQGMSRFRPNLKPTKPKTPPAPEPDPAPSP